MPPPGMRPLLRNVIGIAGFFVISVGLIRFCAALMDKGGKS